MSELFEEELQYLMIEYCQNLMYQKDEKIPLSLRNANQEYFEKMREKFINKWDK